MNKTQALRTASRAVSYWGSGTSWTISCPWDRANPQGPSTEIQCDSHAKARITACRIRAGIALALMGQYTDDTAYTLYDRIGSTRALVNAALSA